MPDPRLKDAMRRIRRILLEYDIGAAVTLVSKSHSEFGYHLPTWSVIQFEGNVVRIRSYEAEYGSKDQQAAAFADSLHCVLQMRDIGVKTFMEMDEIRKFLEGHGFEIEHHPFSGFEPHEEGL
jgi:hypothetical protein